MTFSQSRLHITVGIWVTLLTLVPAFFKIGFILLSPIFGLIAAAVAVLYVRRSQIVLSDDMITVRRGIFMQRTLHLPRARLLAIEHIASPLARLTKSATVIFMASNCTAIVMGVALSDAVKLESYVWGESK